MSGGIAYVLDETGTFPRLVNKEMVELEPLDADDEQGSLQRLIGRHVEYTGSARGEDVLDRTGSDAEGKVRQGDARRLQAGLGSNAQRESKRRAANRPPSWRRCPMGDVKGFMKHGRKHHSEPAGRRSA